MNDERLHIPEGIPEARAEGSPDAGGEGGPPV
jgi:hypothetical protein